MTNQAVERPQSRTLIDFFVNDKPQQIIGPLSVSAALEQLGIGKHASGLKGTDAQWIHPTAACQTGGCWSCSVLIDGVLTRSCVTALRSGMHISTSPKDVDHAAPQRVVTLMRPAPHGHPSIFTHGCNYRCDLCHNWNLTFSSTATAYTPVQTVAQLKLHPEAERWIGISGGEPTLSRKWLVETIGLLRQAAPESHIQLDTNASMLTPDYIDELIDAGITDISPDLKAFRIETFMKMSGVRDRDLAQQYMQTAWKAIEYLIAKYSEQVFMAVSIPCHPRIHSRGELEEMAIALAALNPEIPVTLTELQPAFRKRDMPVLDRKIMEQAARFLSDKGLNRVIIQGGTIIPKAVDPDDLVLGTEDF